MVKLCYYDGNMSKMLYLGVKMPPGVMAEIDNHVATGKYSSRSDFVKSAIRLHLDYLKRMENTTAVTYVKTFDE